ncbi:hypothetical protein PTKIN_Ptkin15bG0155000 [Pterospermum kingtungense]
MIDFSQNQFEGQLPRSLANRHVLETLDMGNNQLNDTFPFWLGNLPELQSYLHATIDLVSQNYHLDHSFALPVTLTSKGTQRDYKKIQDFLVAIDFSSNSFEGCIPQNIGNLKALRLLNLSNNALSCHIPPSLGNLSNLESLDLSHNNLSGGIPTELLQLNFLGVFIVSYNNLTGQIPQGNQFATFENKSFGSNPGLCGKPLSKTCSSASPPLSSEEDQGQEPLLDFDWIIISMGYGSGLVIGLSIGYMYTPKWFMKYLRRMQQKQREARRKPRN